MASFKLPESCRVLRAADVHDAALAHVQGVISDIAVTVISGASIIVLRPSFGSGKAPDRRTPEETSASGL
ncbi:hypothetical protein ACVBGC_32535 [Burkholderia stagnalis]